MSAYKIHTVGIRMDQHTYDRLQELAAATERSMSAVVRLLVKQATTSGFREICLLPRHQPDHRAQAQAGQEVEYGNDNAPT